MSLAAAAASHGHSASPMYAYLIIFGLIAYGLWRLSARTHRYRKCPRCKGSGRLYNPVLRNTFRLCPRCGGSARLTRRGAGAK